MIYAKQIVVPLIQDCVMKTEGFRELFRFEGFIMDRITCSAGFVQIAVHRDGCSKNSWRVWVKYVINTVNMRCWIPPFQKNEDWRLTFTLKILLYQWVTGTNSSQNTEICYSVYWCVTAKISCWLFWGWFVFKAIDRMNGFQFPSGVVGGELPIDALVMVVAPVSPRRNRTTYHYPCHSFVH